MIPGAAPDGCAAGLPGLAPRGRQHGFTLLELLVVVAIIALGAGLVSLAMRDPAAALLDRDAVRLAALLESARSESRVLGLAVQWRPGAAGAEPGQGDAPAMDFRFIGLPAGPDWPSRWLTPGIQAEVVGAPAAVLGPEPLIAAQRIVLRLDQQVRVLSTDGLAPFTVQTDPSQPGS